MSRTIRTCSTPKSCYHHPWKFDFLTLPRSKGGVWKQRGERGFHVRTHTWLEHGRVVHWDGAWCRRRKEAKWAREMLHKSARLANKNRIRQERDVEREDRTEGWVTL